MDKKFLVDLTFVFEYLHPKPRLLEGLKADCSPEAREYGAPLFLPGWIQNLE